MSEMCCMRLAENTGCKNYAKKSPSVHHHTTLSGYIFATKACIDNQKKNLLNSNMSSRCPHSMVNVSPLTPEICWRVSGTPANFNQFHVLASLLQWRPSPEANQTARSLAISWAGTLYTVSQKTSHLWLAITLTHMNGFWHFWQKYYW